MFRKIITYLTIYSFMFSNVCWAAMITPDGRTQTTVNVNGHVYDVTTSTVSGQNAFNSFSNFDVYKGTTVNLYLPGSTLNLINLVRDGKTNIDGILNSIKNGKIGGNVFILNPHGIAIGKSGVVNVGSLMLSTPNKEFMDQVIGQDGSISELATKSVLAGDLPINPAGVISVKGKIKALDSVAVRAGGVVNAGEILANLKPTQASDIVNTGGLDIDAPLAFKDGKIGVFAENDVVNAGTIKADAGGSGKAGGIVVKAGGNISLRKGSLISAKGSAEHKDGGSVVVFADNKADLEKGAEIAADAYDGSAKGGFVELSALKEVNLNGGTMTAGGRDGMIFIDPEILNITSDSAYKGQDNIYAIANIVNVKQGVSLVKENGDITLIARDTDAGWVKKSGAFLNIEDNATLKGDNIYLYALAGDAEVLDGIVTGEVTEDNGSSALTAIGETLKAKGLEFFEALTDSGLFVGYSKSEAEAGINIGKNVTIAAKEDVKINSKVVSNSEVDTLGTGIDVTVAENSAASGVFIDSGVNISGKNVAITSEIDSTTSAEATTSAYGSGRGVPVDIAVAVGLTDTDNKIDIKNGASITATDKLEIAADTRKSHNVAAEGLAYQDGWAAAGVAYSESESSSSVTVGGTIKGGTVNITSDIEAVKNASSAKTVVGNGIFDRLNVWAGNKMLDGLSKWITAIPAQTHSQSNVKLAMSGAVSYSKHNNSSNVKIANNYGEGQTAADTPKTTVTGDKVTIGSHVMDVITNGASASVSPKTNDKDHSQDQNKENSFAGAVGYGVYDNTSRAEIGAGVAVNASQSLELTSETEEPVLWPDASILNVFDGLAGNVLEKGEALLTNIEKYLEDNPMSFYTSLVKSSANTSSGDANPGEEKNGIVGIAGSVNLMEFNNKSDAVIADGAEINQLYNPNNAGYTRLDKAPAVKVSADSYVETFNMSGEYGGAAKFGLGGSYLQTWYDSKVNAIIGDNVKLYAGDLDVNASATHRNLSIAGTAGYKKSDTFGFQGTFDWLKSNSDVLAQISNQADVLVEKADEKSGVTVNAESENSFVNIAGGVVRGSMVGIGASGALNDISQNTRAVIGSLNQNDNSAVTGKIVTDGNILVNAQNSSNLYAVSAAGALITQDKGQDNGSTNFGLGLSGTASYNTLESVSEAYVNNAVIKGVSGASGDEEKRPALEVASNNDNDVLTVGGGVSFVKQSGTNVGIAGAVGINKLDGSRSVAFVNNAKVDNIGDLKIHAASTGEIIAAAESASGAFGKTGITIAGAVSINEIGNRTAAYVSNSKVNGGKFVSADNVEIKAESGADIFALAGNISAAGTGGVGASVAVNEIDNTTESYAKNADIEAEKGNISITAQNTSEIETSSAGVGYGGKASVSGSVSVNNINNRTYGYADNSGLTAYGSVLLKSIAKSVINFYGGMIALSTKGVGGGGTVGTSSVSEDTLAEIRNNSEVNAYGNKPAEDGTTGVGVAAENDSIVNMYGVNAGLGKAAGIGANVAVSQVNNSAVARIDNAKINQDLSGGNDEKYAVNQEVNVFAANKTQLETHAGTLAGGTVGVGLSSVTTLVENTTKAEIVNGSNVKSKGDIGVNTDAKTYFNSVVVGGAGGKVGVAGNVNVAEIGNHNRALVDASTIAGYGSMTVAAKDVTRLGKRLKDDGTEEDFAVALGAGGVGLYNGTGASVLVSDIANDTTAKIGNSSVDVAKKLSLTADSDSSILSYVFAAGLGAYSGVAGSVAVNTIDNTTEAFITEDEGKTTEINQNMSNASQDVKIAASADAAIENLLGSAAVGLGSGGASVDVSTIDGRTSAGTIGSLALSAGRNVDITADSVRDISVEGIAGSGGAGTLSGAISVIRVGSNYTADMQEQTAGVLETVNAEIARNNEYQDSLNINGLPTDIDLSEFDRDVNKEFSTSVSKDVGTSAYVGSGATVKAGGNIAVAATDDVHTRNLTGEMAAGGVSAGASVGITDIRNAAKAYIAGNALVASGKDFSLSALTKTDVDSKSMGGVIATMFAAGGSVVHVNADSHAQAYVGNGAVVNAGNVTMEAEDESDIEALAAGVEASVGGAAGASVAIVNKTNDVRAFVADGAKVTADSFEGSAKDDVSVDVQAIAGAAGVVSGEGAYAESSIVSKLKSYVGDAVFKLAEGFRMFTSGSSHGNAGALGVNAGVLSVGASVAKSDIDLDNQAVVDGSAEIAAADVYVGAGQLKADAVTDSLAAAGALIGGNGAQSSAGVGGKVLAKVEDGAKFTGAGNVEILSMSNSGQAAVSSAYRGGILAAGATLADAAGHLDTITEIGAIDLTADKLTAKAEATDILYAETVSGSGGVISGAAAISGTKNDAETKVTIGTDGKDGHFDLEALEVLASRSVKQNGTADSVNASVVGASGARVDNVSNAVTAVDIKGNAEFAVNDVNVKAINTYDKNGKFAYNGSGWSESGVDYNIQSGSGGVVDAPAVISKTVIDNEATVDFGADTVFSRNVARKEKEKDYQFAVSALNDVKATDKAKLVSGGVLAIADTVSSIDNRKNKAAVNLKGSIASIDDLILTANSNANLNSEVYVNTYGASGVAMGSSTVRTTSDNSVNFADGSRTMSYGDLHVYAGQAYEDYSGNNTLHSRVYLWNNTALPFSDPEVEATIVMNNLINIDSGAVVKSGRDINLTSNMGIAVADGFSSAKNPYNELLSLEDKSFNGTVDNNSRIVVNGTAEAGVNNIQKFIIDENGRVKVTIGEETFYDDDQLYHKKTGEKLYSNIIDEINRMKNLRAEYIEDKDAVAYYDAEIAALQAKLTLMGLYSENGGTVNTTVDYITLGDIYAQPGAISLNTQSMEGTGLMSVTSDAAVTIENKSSSFLRVSDITIPEGSGGTVKLNGAAVTGDIGSLKVHIAEKTMESPTVTITSDIAANDGRAPNIDIDGTVTNYGGLVKVNNAAGSIYVNGTIHGKDLNITAGRDIYQGYTNGFRHIGGSPEAAWDAIASGNESGHLTDGSATASSNADIDDSRSSLVAGNNIFLSGRYINLNGLVQSGTTDYNLDIPDGEIQLAGGLTSETALADYNRNKQYNYNASPLYKLSDKYGNVDAYYNAVTGQIELADVRVEGGYVEIYGHILNTSQNSGEIMVTDGYGRVNINNRSGKEIVVNNMSLSNRISGVIKITDLAKKNAAGEYLQTTYTRNGNTITVADNNGGNTSVNAAGSIFGASADSLISGGKISLTAQTGSIGTDDTALKIQTSGDEDSALTVLANNNVNLVQEEGDLGLESVVSLAGDVNVKVENGSVFDANTNEVYDDKTVEQLTKIWDDMGLDVGNEQMKEAFLNGKKAEYNAYWQYKSRQPEGGEPEFRFTAAEREALLNKELNESEKQALGMDKITDEYINRLEAEKTAEYKKLAAVYGDEGKYGSSYDAGWTYRLSEAEEAELAEGAGWNKSQLAYSIFKAKEGEVVDTQYMIEDPNVVGKNVTIEANGSIGQDTGSETFKLSELSPETDVDKILLIASAERDNLEIAEDGDTVTVHKREDVDIHADSITLKARDYIYLGGEEDINVNTVEAGEGQKITIAGAKGIYNVATEADHANVIGGDLVLEAADGSIGTEDKALNLKLADGAKVTARSQNDIFLNSTGGDLVAESLLAKDGVLSLTADGSLIAGTLKEGEIVNLQGQSIVVNAENVGDEDNYLTVALGDKENEEHTLTLNVAGDANVNNLGAQELAVESSAVGGTLRLKSASSLIGATADSLLSAAALEFNGVGGDIGAAGRYLNVSTERLTASADGSIYLNNVRSAVFEGVNAGREIEITSAADLTLNDATAGGSVKVNGAGSLFANNLRAGGDLLMTAENDLDVSGATAEGSVTLVSRLGDMVADLIGSGGDMKIDAAGNLTAGNINAGEKVSIAADSADLDEVVSGGDMRIAVNSDNIFGRLTSEKGNIALTVENADANLRGSVKAANGRVTVTAGGSVLNAGAPAEGAIIANTVDLTAKNGSIGTSGNYLTVDSSYTEPGWISALAEKGIFISEVNGDMNVRRFASNGDIDMRVESSIMAAPGMDPEVPNFKADNITLHTNGSIGMPDNRLVLALNDNGRGKINLKAETGIAVNKLGDGLVSDYVYNLQSGKVMIGLPSGHANIARVTAVGGFELYVREHTDFYNIWLGISDLEARMMNPPYTEYPSENPIEIMRAPLLDRYKLQTGDGLFMNIGSLTGEEEKLSVGF